MELLRKVNSGVVRLVRGALDSSGELSKEQLVLVEGELGRLKRLLEEEVKQLAAIQRIEADIRKLTEKADVPKRRAYPLREAATLMGVSLTKLKDLVRDGAIAIVNAGKRRRILDAEINRYLLRRARQSPRAPPSGGGPRG